jgi:V/A-type H+-transporting ATPase subunit I
MDRVAVVASADCLRAVLVATADAGLVELERVREPDRGPAGAALEKIRNEPAFGRAMPPTRTVPSPILLPDTPDLNALAGRGRVAELAGEAELERTASHALRRGAVVALAGWCPSAAVTALAERLGELGGALVRLPAPVGSAPPTLLEDGPASAPFQPLVDTYGTVPYRDLNPSVLAGLAYVAMFGMMFGDVGDGLLLLAAGILLRHGRPRLLAGFAGLAPFLIGGGIASAGFGFAYGEAFGPTGLVPTVWLRPVDHAATLLAVAVAAGAALLAGAYVLGTINRWREGGPRVALRAMAGGAGAAVYLGLGVAGLGWYTGNTGVEAAGAALAATGLILGFRGCYLMAGKRPQGAMQAAVEMFDAVIRIGANTISFARLAAFGLTHAALADVVWRGTTALGHRGDALWLAAALLFVVGSTAAFALEGLVAGVQALRLEYYELFSRIFTSEGRPFRPWHVTTCKPEEASCSHG